MPLKALGSKTLRPRHLWLLTILLSSGAVLAPSTLQAAGADVDAEYRDPDEPNPGTQTVIFRDQPLKGFSYLRMRTETDRIARNYCISLTDPKCAGGTEFEYTAFLPPCRTNSQLDCIAGFGAASQLNDKTRGNFIGTFPTVARHGFLGDSGQKLPSGGAPTLWRLDSLPHAGGTTYMVQVVSSGSTRGTSFDLSDFSIQINPIELMPDPCIPNQGASPDCIEDQGLGFYEELEGVASRVTRTSFDCLLVAEAQCARRHAFLAATRLYVDVRLSQPPSGWFHGRISNPTVLVQPLDGTAVEISISADIVQVPVVSQSAYFSELPASLQSAYRATGGFNGTSPFGTRIRSTRMGGPEVRNAISLPAPDSPEGMSELLAWLPHISDTATANIGTWAVRSMWGKDASANSCFKSSEQPAGLVTTNATQYSAGPPIFDKFARSLEYKVAAPHYTSSGNVFTGTYDLVMRSEIARCLYGFSNAPLNATISVLDDNGASRVATKIVSERDGWLRLAAYGFGFSNPTIKILLTQEKQEISPVAKNRTIRCRKGNAVKKVTALRPTCPKGYKRI